MTSKTPTKLRLDQLLVDRGLVETRSQAQGLILAGQVLSQNKVMDKPGQQVKSDIPLSLKEQLRYVSRGGLKLEKALSTFGIDPGGQVAMDVGASTGGFTDCLLQHGASCVHAIDVGTNQLDWRLRQDPRVQVQEQTHILKIEPGSLSPAPTLAVIDVAFIGLLKVLPHVAQCLTAGAEPPPCLPPEGEEAMRVEGSVLPTEPSFQIIALIKPQFEFETYCGKSSQFKGVVTHKAHIQTILTGVLQDISTHLPAWTITGLVESPIQGPKGNHEYLLSLVLCHQRASTETEIEKWVDQVLSPLDVTAP